MKRKLLYVAGFVFMLLAVDSCDTLKNCKVCAQNTYDNSNALITSGSETDYCDAELIKIKATPPVTVLGVTTKWVCR